MGGVGPERLDDGTDLAQHAPLLPVLGVDPLAAQSGVRVYYLQHAPAEVSRREALVPEGYSSYYDSTQLDAHARNLARHGANAHARKQPVRAVLKRVRGRVALELTELDGEPEHITHAVREAPHSREDEVCRSACVPVISSASPKRVTAGKTAAAGPKQYTSSQARLYKYYNQSKVLTQRDTVTGISIGR